MAFIFLLGWMLSLTTVSSDDESISFSPVSKSFSNSYWYGNMTISKENSIIDKGISVKVQLNQFQGLLFYSIDSRYRTFWVEFAQDMLDIYYYNFKIDEADKYSFKVTDICIHLYDKKLTLSFIGKNNEIIITCNGNSKTIDYVRPPEIISEYKFKLFKENMHLPVPYFNDDVVYLWIGNTPIRSDDKYQNIEEWKSNRDNFWGCVEFFKIKGTILKLATSGNHVGELIKPFCKPVCNPRSCFNYGKCSELWRERFSCDCGFSQFVGDRCNLEYSVKFNGNFSLQHSTYFKFQKLQFAFKPVIDNEHKGLKVISLRLLKDQYFQIYIDAAEFLHARFVKTTDWIIDEVLKLKILNNKVYVVFIDVNIDEIQIQLIDLLDKSLSQKTIIRHKESNIIIKDILVGNSHSQSMDWMKKFEGCLTNLMLKVDLRKFIWNDIKNFDKLPNCKEVIKNTPKSIESRTPESQNRSQNSQALLPVVSNTTQNKNDYMIYITIASIFISLFIVTLLIVIIIKFKLTNQKSLSESSDKIRLTDNFNRSFAQPQLPEQGYMQSLCNSPTNSNNIYTSPIYMTFKPAYKARSMTSSITNRSMMSLPNPTSPTLATQEDGEL